MAKLTKKQGVVSFRSGLLCAVVAVMALPGVGYAWNAAGHSTIDLMVYKRLTPETRAKLDTILRAHPRYREDLLKDMPAGANEAEFAFARAGTWPDVVRDKRVPIYAAYHKGNWHYTDVPYHPEGGEEKYRGEPAVPAKAGEPYDSVSAWEYNLNRLNDVLVPLPERAVALCWVLHLGGDIHQPCHNVSLYSPRFPTGDKGANEWMFTHEDKRRNLHSLWDGWLGNDVDIATVSAKAEELATAHPEEKFAEELKVKDVREWVQEGRFLAIKNVYLDGKLQGISKTEADANTALPLPKLSDEYVTDALAVATRRAAIGAYRITADLNGLTLAMPPAK